MEGEQVVYIPQLHSSLYWGALSWAVFGIVIMVFPTDGTLFKIQLSASLILIRKHPILADFHTNK